MRDRCWMKKRCNNVCNWGSRNCQRLTALPSRLKRWTRVAEVNKVNGLLHPGELSATRHKGTCSCSWSWAIVEEHLGERDVTECQVAGEPKSRQQHRPRARASQHHEGRHPTRSFWELCQQWAHVPNVGPFSGWRGSAQPRTQQTAMLCVFWHLSTRTGINFGDLNYSSSSVDQSIRANFCFATFDGK